MKTTDNRPAFVTVRDWTQPQVITPYGLAGMIADAKAHGFEAVRMERTRFPFGYRVTFQHKDTRSLSPLSQDQCRLSK